MHDQLCQYIYSKKSTLDWDTCKLIIVYDLDCKNCHRFLSDIDDEHNLICTTNFVRSHWIFFW